MNAIPMPRRVPDNGPRALETCQEILLGCFTINVDDERHWPHLRPGEVAIVDARQRDVEWGELYAVRQSAGPKIWQVCRTPAAYGNPSPNRPTAMLNPLNRGRSLSDGPIYLDALATKILGRVVGILAEPAYDPVKGAGTPRERPTLPHVRAEDEIRWRYLAWLSAEREALAAELGARSRLGIYVMEDAPVSEFFMDGGNWREGQTGNRALVVLEAAGVSTKPDPHWVGLIP